MISLKSVKVAFEGRTVLEDINLDINEKRVGVIGWNGSGKSTFARLLNGLQTPTAGSVTIDGADTAKAGGHVRRKVGFVFQNPDNQIVYPVVEEDLEFGLRNLNISKEERKRRIDEIFQQYGLDHLRSRMTHRLSGGEKQMIALMGVLVMHPEIIVLDEPTTLLDLKNKHNLLSVLHELPQQIVMVTHDLELLSDFDRVLFFHDGKLYADGEPEEVIATYRKVSGVC
ncbi:ATP-binding cassette domain-containing protein [Sneathiella sp. P13V-1]|uniref:energy-coupling factor ABC transporter ATP-binding protein n=1 Tax=Sneathiella sp. P13V-1 TaxID=2697366 RepID=UPI00187B2367|nr:ATP-binding cassette domain-containing protein [Sneathiella sp. P13V-1]MBE7638427.1 ATP-binding cassette domain-containing protein [Sneathiella sp. P13V-1]